MTDFDSLFAAFWEERLPSGVLADWLREWWEEGDQQAIEATYGYKGSQCVHLTAYVPAGLPDVLALSTADYSMGTYERRHFRDDDISTELEKWLRDQIDFTLYLLEK